MFITYQFCPTMLTNCWNGNAFVFYNRSSNLTEKKKTPTVTLVSCLTWAFSLLRAAAFCPSRTLTPTPPLHTDSRPRTRLQRPPWLPSAPVQWEAVQLTINHTMYTTSKHLKAIIAMGVNLQGSFTVLGQVSLYIHMCTCGHTCTYSKTFLFLNPPKTMF